VGVIVGIILRAREREIEKERKKGLCVCEKREEITTIAHSLQSLTFLSHMKVVSNMTCIYP
jgi:hypothetical protein